MALRATQLSGQASSLRSMQRVPSAKLQVGRTHPIPTQHWEFGTFHGFLQKWPHWFGNHSQSLQAFILLACQAVFTPQRTGEALTRWSYFHIRLLLPARVSGSWQHHQHQRERDASIHFNANPQTARTCFFQTPELFEHSLPKLQNSSNMLSPKS